MSRPVETGYLNLLREENRLEVEKLLEIRARESRPLSDELLRLATKWRVALDYLLMDDASANAAGITNFLKGSWGTIPDETEIHRLCALIMTECSEAYQNWITHTMDDLALYGGAVFVVDRLNIPFWHGNGELLTLAKARGVVFPTE